MAQAPIDDNHHKGLIIRDGLAGDALDLTGESLTNANALHVAIVDGNGNQITSFGGSGGTSATDDAAFTAGSGTGTPMMGFVTSDSVDSGDVGVVGMLTNRQLKVTLYDSGGSELAVGGGTQYTEDAAAAANPIGNALNLVRDDARGGSLTTTDGDNVAARGTNAGELYVKHVDSIAVTNAGLTELAAAINASSQMDVNIAANGIGLSTSAKQDTGNTSLATIAGAVSGTEMQVDILSSALPTGASTLAEQQSQTTHLGTIAGDTTAIETAVQLIDDGVYTDDTSTHSTGSSKGYGIMAVATPSDASVNANDFGHVAMSTDRRQLIDATLQLADSDISATNALPTKGVPSDIDINGSNANHADKYYTNAGAVTDGIIWSPAAGKRWHVLTLYINVSAAATVTLEDDLAGGDVARWKGELAANSGVVLTYDKEHPFSSGEDAADLIITTTAGNVYVQAVGYEV